MKPHDSGNSNSLSIVLVDDDASFAVSMRERLARCFAETEERYAFMVFPDAEAFWREYDTLRLDIVFFDIMLPGESGLEMAKKLYARDKRTAIVFITASPDFAVAGYGVNALGYIVKPTSTVALREIMTACKERLYPSCNHALTVRDAGDAGGKRVIRLTSIRYLESNYRRVSFHCDGETVLCVGKLDDFQPGLSPNFFQVHKSFIVNLDRAQVLRTAEIVMDNGEAVPVSRAFRKQTAEVFFARLAVETGGR